MLLTCRTMKKASSSDRRNRNRVGTNQSRKDSGRKTPDGASVIVHEETKERKEPGVPGTMLLPSREARKMDPQTFGEDSRNGYSSIAAIMSALRVKEHCFPGRRRRSARGPWCRGRRTTMSLSSRSHRPGDSPGRGLGRLILSSGDCKGAGKCQGRIRYRGRPPARSLSRSGGRKS
jgi:hypothetical protein